jgi:DNA repair photolyase
VLRAFKHPVAITTKGTLIERDIDLLAEMAAHGLARVGISVTTLDANLSRKMEPRVAAPKRRLQVIERLARAGIPVRVMVAPVVPGLTDHELEPILRSAKDAGAVAASYISLRLPREVSEIFQAWLAEHVPDRAAKVMGRVRELHGGRDYDPDFGKRMFGSGIWADLLRKRFHIAVDRLGLAVKMPDIRSDLFQVPLRSGDQMSLF